MAGVATAQAAIMSHEHSRRSSLVPFGAPDSIPNAPPLPAPRPLQRARDAANRLFGYSSRPPSPQEEDRLRRGSRARFASLSATENATTSHRTGLAINTLSINEEGTHALIGGKEIFKTVKVEDGSCAEDLNLRSAIRSTPTQASGKTRQIYSIDIADVAWAKGDTGHYVAAATSSGKIILYDLGHAGIPAAQLHEHFRQVHKVTFNPHRGSLLLSGSQDGTVRLWDVRDVRQASTLKSKHKYSGQSDGVRDVKWSPTDGVDFAFGTDSGWIQRWDMRNLKTAKIKIPAHSTTCNTIDWHPDGKHIVSAGSDKTVRVYDFSISRRQRANWEIKTPYPVLNARWRPSCESTVPVGNASRQCTQIVTSYDQSHPVLHIWDFRRPSLPFREIAPYSTAPTDLLWHSQDLLWTVGREGVFLQSDIQHAQKTIEKRNLQALAVSPQGDINFVTLKRHQRRLSKPPQTTPLLRSTSGHKSEQSVFSRSWQDDSLDNSFLSHIPVRKTENEQTRPKTRTQSLNMGPWSEQLQVAVSTIPLDEILLFRNSTRPIQFAIRGIFPGYMDGTVRAYMARKIKVELQDVYAAEDFLAAFDELIERNARAIELAGFYQLGQTWRIAGFIVKWHLKERSKHRKKLVSEGKPQIRMPAGNGDLSKLARRMMGAQGKSPSPTPSTMKPVSTLARQLALSDEASSQPTPLARPTTSGKSAGGMGITVLPDPDVAEHLTLPPSLSPTTSDQDVDGRLTSTNLDGLQRLHQHPNGQDRADMVRKWSVQPKEPLSLDIVDTNGVKVPPRLEKRDSDESFAFLEGSLDSRGPSFPSSHASTGSGPLRMVSERPSRTNLGRNFEKGSTSAVDFANGLPEPSKVSLFDVANLSGRPEPSRFLTAEESDIRAHQNGDHSTHENAMEDDLGPGSYPDEWGIFPAAELQPAKAPPVETMKKSIVADPTHDLTKEHQSQVPKPAKERPVYDDKKNTWQYLPEDGDPDLEEGKPFVLKEMLHELMRYYVDEGNAQTASQLLLLLGPLLPRTHPLPQSEIQSVVSEYVEYFTTAGFPPKEIEAILDEHVESLVTSGLNPMQNEAILATYHEQLLHLQLYNEAALLRKLSYPIYPSVYEDFLKDHEIHLRCGSCKKPMSRTLNGTKCENCKQKPATCPICWLNWSPFETEAASKLWTACLLCNHGGHTACLNQWFNESGEEDGGCPAKGCLCDCTPGEWRAEKAKIAERKRHSRGHSRVKSDDWAAQESRAVEKTREVLGLGVGFGKGSKAGSSA